MHRRPEDFQALVKLLEKAKPSHIGGKEEWALLLSLDMKDLVQRHYEAWAFLCRRSITRLMRLREEVGQEELQAAIDTAVADIQRLAGSP